MGTESLDACMPAEFQRGAQCLLSENAEERDAQDERFEIFRLLVVFRR